MSEAAEVLVIILSLFLAFFLVLAIVLIVMLIKVTKQIREAARSAQSTIDHVNSFVVGFSKITSPALVAKMILKQIKKVRKDD